MGSGDIFAQKLVEEREAWDKARTLRFVAIGSCLMGPSCTWWYRQLDRVIPMLKVPKSAQGLAKTVLDQSMFAPTLLFVFMRIVGTLRSDPPAYIDENVRKDYFRILLNNYKLWPAVQLLNFYVVPLQHRVMVVNVVALFWNTYLSWCTNQNNDEVRVTELLPELKGVVHSDHKNSVD